MYHDELLRALRPVAQRHGIQISYTEDRHTGVRSSGLVDFACHLAEIIRGSDGDGPPKLYPKNIMPQHSALLRRLIDLIAEENKRENDKSAAK